MKISIHNFPCQLKSENHNQDSPLVDVSLEADADRAILESFKDLSNIWVEAYRQIFENMKTFMNMFIIINSGIAVGLFSIDKPPENLNMCITLFLLSAFSAAGGIVSLSRYSKNDFIMLSDLIINKTRIEENVIMLREKYKRNPKLYTVFAFTSILASVVGIIMTSYIVFF